MSPLCGLSVRWYVRWVIISQAENSAGRQGPCPYCGPHSRALSFTLCLSIYLPRSARRHTGSLLQQRRVVVVGGVFSYQAEDRQRRDKEQAGRQLGRGLLFCCLSAMVKCLIRIQTKVNVHLRMINHCYRDVKVRVLSLGPRLLGKALGALPLFPALPGGFSASGSRPGSEQSSGTVPQQLYGFSPPARQPGKKGGQCL